MLEAFLDAAVVIVERGVVFQHAALYFEIVDAARKRIGEGFENEERKRLAVVILALDTVAFAIGILVSDLRMLIGMRKGVGKKREQAGRTDVVQRGHHQDGKDFFGDDGFADCRDQIVDRNGAFAEKL